MERLISYIPRRNRETIFWNTIILLYIMNSFGFIITRHVNSEKSNKYWNRCVKLLRTFYPHRQIVIIDDNSNYAFVKSDADYRNLTIIQSEFHGRGELLPYYYYIKNLRNALEEYGEVTKLNDEGATIKINLQDIINKVEPDEDDLDDRTLLDLIIIYLSKCLTIKSSIFDFCFP